MCLTFRSTKLDPTQDAPLNAWRADPQSRTPVGAGGGPLCAWHRTTEGPQAREPSKCLNRQSYGERLAKEAFWLLATRGSKNKQTKTNSDRAITPVAEAVCVPAQFGVIRVPVTQAAASPSCSTLTGAELPQALHLCTRCHLGCVHLFETLWAVACQVSLSVGFSRQEYWSVLANTVSL